MLRDPALHLFDPYDRASRGEHDGGDVLNHLLFPGHEDLVCLELLQLLRHLISFLEQTTDQVGGDMELLGDVLVQLMGLLSSCQNVGDLLVSQVLAMSLLKFATCTSI